MNLQVCCVCAVLLVVCVTESRGVVTNTISWQNAPGGLRDRKSLDGYSFTYNGTNVGVGVGGYSNLVSMLEKSERQSVVVIAPDPAVLIFEDGHPNGKLLGSWMEMNNVPLRRSSVSRTNVVWSMFPFVLRPDLLNAFRSRDVTIVHSSCNSNESGRIVEAEMNDLLLLGYPSVETWIHKVFVRIREGKRAHHVSVTDGLIGAW